MGALARVERTTDRQKNANIGTVNCGWCGTESYVRKDKNGKLYVSCNDCGLQKMNTPSGQERLLTAAHIWGASVKKFAPTACAEVEAEAEIETVVIESTDEPKKPPKKKTAKKKKPPKGENADIETADDKGNFWDDI